MRLQTLLLAESVSETIGVFCPISVRRMSFTSRKPLVQSLNAVRRLPFDHLCPACPAPALLATSFKHQ